MTTQENDTPVDDSATPEADAPEVAAPENDEVAQLHEQLAAVQQDLLYARAETQNVRRRLEKEQLQAVLHKLTAEAAGCCPAFLAA